MGFLKKAASFWGTNIAPITLPIAGGAVGGPAGAMVGSNVAGMLQPKDNSADEASRREYERQKEFAQMGVRWKAEDARAAGLHPLAAMGAQTNSYAAQSVGGEQYGGSSMADMGQNLSSMMSATSTNSEKEMHALQIQGLKLDNENRHMDSLLKQQALDQNSRGNPGFPVSGDQNFVPGQANSGGPISEKAMERTASMKGAPHSEPGAVTDVGWVKTPTGVVPVPSKDAKERTEDVMPHEYMHFYRNNVLPNFGKGPKPPARKGHYWVWSYKDQEFQERSTKDLKNRYRGTRVPR